MKKKTTATKKTTKKVKQIKYMITQEWSEKDHMIVENWICKGETNLKKKLAEALDLPIDKDGLPKEPVLAELQKNLQDYADKKFICDEYERMETNWNIYNAVLEDALKAGTGLEQVGTNVQIDSNTQLIVEWDND